MLENFELKNMLQQMKQELVAMLSPKSHIQRQKNYTEFTDLVSQWKLLMTKTRNQSNLIHCEIQC